MSDSFGKFTGPNGARIILSLRHIQAFEEGLDEHGYTRVALDDGNVIQIQESIEEIWAMFDMEPQQ